MVCLEIGYHNIAWSKKKTGILGCLISDKPILHMWMSWYCSLHIMRYDEGMAPVWEWPSCHAEHEDQPVRNWSTCFEKQTWMFPSMDINGGTPKLSILIGCSLLNHLFWGTPIYGNLHMCLLVSTISRLRILDLEDLVFQYVWHRMLLETCDVSSWTVISSDNKLSIGVNSRYWYDWYGRMTPHIFFFMFVLSISCSAILPQIDLGTPRFVCRISPQFCMGHWAHWCFQARDHRPGAGNIGRICLFGGHSNRPKFGGYDYGFHRHGATPIAWMLCFRENPIVRHGWWLGVPKNDETESPKFIQILFELEAMTIDNSVW